MAEELYRYKMPDVAPHFPKPGGGAPGNAIRSWCRRGLITGFHQPSKNAEYRLSARGVKEAWILWAAHKGLDPEAGLPKEIRRIIESIEEQRPSVDAAGRPVVRIEVPPGVGVEVVYRAA
jgi:hypothetical protein